MRGTQIQFPAKALVTACVFGAPLAVGLVESVRGAWSSDGSWSSTPRAPMEGAVGSGGFLWVMLLEALKNLGLDPDALGRYLSLVSWSGLLAVLVVHALRAPIGPWRGAAVSGCVPRERRDAVLLLPVAAWGLALHRDAQIHAGGGLDVSLLALLLAGGLLLLVNHPRQVGLTAAVYALTVLLRPWGWFYSGTALAYLLWRGNRRIAGRFAAVWGALVIPFVIWELGDAGRTAWRAGFADAGSPASWSRGWTYTSEYFRIYTVLPVCGLGALAGWIGATTGRRDRDPRLDVVLVALVQVLLTLVVVMRAGGDVAFGRGYVPVTPLLYLVAEEVVRVTGRRFAVATLAILVLAMTLGARLSA